MAGTLYVVATPIGNLNDMTPRAVETLKNADLIAAEDTRNTLKLLQRFEIDTPMTSNHKFNEFKAVDRLVDMLKEGKDIAVVSDAGTPCVNDPGYVLIRAAAESGINVVGVSGACAAVTAVSVSGLPADTFRFMGFFPREKKEALKITEMIRARENELYIFYESPLRIEESLKIVRDELPNDKCVLCNDLTKLHERIYRGTPGEVLEELSVNPNAKKGEYAFLIYHEAGTASEDAPGETVLTPEALLVDEIARTGCTVKEAIAVLSKDPAVPASKNDLYAASLRLKEMFG